MLVLFLPMFMYTSSMENQIQFELRLTVSEIFLCGSNPRNGCLVLCTDTLPGIGSLPDVQARAGRVVSSKSISSNHRIISDFDLYTCSQKNKDADFDLASIHGSRLHHKSTFKIDGSIDVHGHRIRSTDHQIGSRCLRTCL